MTEHRMTMAEKTMIAGHLDDVVRRAVREKNKARSDYDKAYWDAIKANARDEAARLRASLRGAVVMRPRDGSGPCEAATQTSQRTGRQAAHRFNNDLRYSDGTDMRHRQMTPGYVLDPVREALGGIGLDPCTEAVNPCGADRFYTAADDGLTAPWHDADWLPSVYCNPPYTKAREPWVARCVEAAARGQRVVLLMPAATDTRVFQRVLGSASTVVFVRGRVKFGVLRENRRQEAASHPSALVGWNVDLRVTCRRLGFVVEVGE